MKGNTPKQKKIPLRRCVGCGESFPKKELIRVVRPPEGEVTLDFTGKKSGRGVYICKNAKCFSKARKAGRFAKNLECEVPDSLLDALEEEVRAAEEDARAAE